MKNKFNLDKAMSLFTICVLFLVMNPAQAHHAMDGKLTNSSFDGLLSGLAHPVIDMAHLVFIIAISVLASISHRRGFLIPTVFIFATLIGALLQYSNAPFAFNEIAVAASVIFVSGLLFARVRSSLPSLLLFSSIAGISHGIAYGESIIGAETNYLLSYLIGFSIIQLAISFTLYRSLSMWLGRTRFNTTSLLRYTGITFGLIGTLLLATST